MAENRTPRTVYWLVLAAMLFGGLATANGLDSRSGGRLAYSIAILVGEVALAGFAVVMLVRTRQRE